MTPHACGPAATWFRAAASADAPTRKPPEVRGQVTFTATELEIVQLAVAAIERLPIVIEFLGDDLET